MIRRRMGIEDGGVPTATLRALLLLLLCAASLSAQFQDVAKQHGIDFKLVSGSPKKPYILESMAGGVGFLDFDNDGWIDIYLVNGSTLAAEKNASNKASDRLFRQMGIRLTQVAPRCSMPADGRLPSEPDRIRVPF